MLGESLQGGCRNLRRVPFLAPSGDSKRESREWLNALAFGGMAAWFGGCLLLTLGYPALGVDPVSVGCSSPVLCRSFSEWGGHSVVWLIVWGFGLTLGVVFRNFAYGFVKAVFWGSLHEMTWNGIAIAAFGVVWFRGLDVRVAIFVVSSFLIAGVCLSSRKIRATVEWRRLVTLLPFWALFMLLWLSIGFPVTLYQGMTVWYLNLPVNLVELCSYLLWFGIAVAVEKFPSRFWWSSSPVRNSSGEMASSGVLGS